MSGLTLEEIGDYYGVSKQAIHQQLQGVWELLDKPNELDAYRKFNVELLTAAEKKVLTELVKDEKLEKASGNNLAYMLTQLHQARRLEAGESTSNIALHAIVESMERDRAGKQAALPESELDDDDAVR